VKLFNPRYIFLLCTYKRLINKCDIFVTNILNNFKTIISVFFCEFYKGKKRIIISNRYWL